MPDHQDTRLPPLESGDRKKIWGNLNSNSSFGPSWNPWVQKQVLSVLPSFCLEKKKATDASHLHDAAVEIKSGVVLSIAMAHADNRRAKVQVERGQWTPTCETFIANSDTSATISAVKFQTEFRSPLLSGKTKPPTIGSMNEFTHAVRRTAGDCWPAKINTSP